MKKYLYIVLGLALTFTSCEDVLDKEPLGLISDATVWQDENLVNVYISDIYEQIRFFNRTGQGHFNAAMVGSMGGEFRVIGGWQEPYLASTAIIDERGASTNLRYWKYSNLRKANEAIKQLQTVSELDQDFIDKKVAEVRFLRGYIFFEMVKRYGGVPIITEPQPLDATYEELFRTRNTEQEVYDFIGSEMDAVAAILPEQAEERGRPSKWAALALKSRAMLYLASIGEFGNVQLNGLLGTTDAQKYWQQAYDASKVIIDGSSHSLYQKHGDKAKNFQELFIDEDGNPEVIFSEIFDEGLLRTTSFSRLCMPGGFTAGWGSNYNVFYDAVELFEFEDGSTGKIPRSEITDREWSSEELFGSRDPRFRASVFYPETPWQGSKVYFHSSTTGTAPAGWPSASTSRNRNRVGFHLRKRLDEGTLLPESYTDDTDYIVFRLGEIYLNLAEAAFNLGKTGEALDAINVVRDRAGMPAKATITQDLIRNERQVELFAEDHRYWDLRRWRIAQQVLDGIRLQGLNYTYNGDTGKYKIAFVNGEHVARTFQDRHYYLPLGLGLISDNPNLVENPGY